VKQVKLKLSVCLNIKHHAIFPPFLGATLDGNEPRVSNGIFRHVRLLDYHELYLSADKFAVLTGHARRTTRLFRNR
jgi:hypothetical protein